MSDTVLVALITLASGVFGSIIASVFTYRTSMLGIRSEQRKMLLGEKKSAYATMLSAYALAIEVSAKLEAEELLPGGDEAIEAMLRLHNAETVIMLFAPNRVREAANAVTLDLVKGIHSCQLSSNRALFDEMLDEMRNDLLSFSLAKARRP